MYVNLKILFKAQYIAFFRRRFRLRRWALVILFSGIFYVFCSVLAVARLLDHLFFPGFRKQKVRDPVFVIATPRSGTTFLQSLLCLDEERFTCMKLYQTIFPAIVFQRFFDAVAWIDRRSGRILSRVVIWSEKKFFGGWDGMHPMAFTKTEEDEGLFVYTLMVESLYLLFPYVDQLREAAFADLLPPAKRAKLMRYYRSCLQRHLYATGPDKTLLSKNPSLSGRIESLLETFEDARVIYLIRHPDETVPSHVSLFYKAWLVHSPEIAKASPETMEYARVAVGFYRHMLKNRDKFDDRRYLCIPYTDLVAAPRETVERIYAHFGFEMSDRFKARLEDATQRSRKYRSSHEYSLEEFGLSKEWIREELGDVLDAYSLER